MSPQNPTGCTILAERRHAVYRLCQRYGILLLEDDPYFFLQYPQGPGDQPARPCPSLLPPSLVPVALQTPPLRLLPHRQDLCPAELLLCVALPLPFRRTAFASHAHTPAVPLRRVCPPPADAVPGLHGLRGAGSYLSLDTDGRVVRIDSFAKFLAPGLRLGWVTAHPRITEKLTMTIQVGWGVVVVVVGSLPEHVVGAAVLSTAGPVAGKLQGSYAVHSISASAAASAVRLCATHGLVSPLPGIHSPLTVYPSAVAHRGAVLAEPGGHVSHPGGMG